jgi:hypothetical protein
MAIGARACRKDGESAATAPGSGARWSLRRGRSLQVKYYRLKIL